mmetsp:Transcript_21530/g.64062  ORF Transcript_21530/g.64062 Transcript_21530/m.64062 type:complete len:141 (-) Transcript_21530:492-914(-)
MLANADEHKEQDRALGESLAAKANLEQYTFQLKAYITDPDLENAKNDSMEVIEELLETLSGEIESTSEWIDANPGESKETYAARRAELQATATPVVDHLRQVYADIAAAKEAKEEGQEQPSEPGEDEDEEVGDGHDPDDL